MSAAIRVPECLPHRRAHVSVLRVIAVVARTMDTTVAAITGASRHKSVTFARHVAMCVARRMTIASYPELGLAFGARDHTTAMNGARRIELLAKTDEALRELLETIETEVARST